MKRISTLSTAAILLAGFSASIHAADDVAAQAKAYTAQATRTSLPWSGPTTGPAAQQGKSIVFVSADQRDSGPRGVSEAVQQAAKTIGWTYRMIDGQGSISGRSAALNQAIALKPNGIVLGSVDAKEQAVLIQHLHRAASRLSGGIHLRSQGRRPSKAFLQTSPPIRWMSPRQR